GQHSSFTVIVCPSLITALTRCRGWLAEEWQRIALRRAGSNSANYEAFPANLCIGHEADDTSNLTGPCSMGHTSAISRHEPIATIPDASLGASANVRPDIRVEQEGVFGMESTSRSTNGALFDLADPANAYVFGFLQADGTHTAGSGRKGRVSVEIKADDVQ